MKVAKVYQPIKEITRKANDSDTHVTIPEWNQNSIKLIPNDQVTIQIHWTSPMETMCFPNYWKQRGGDSEPPCQYVVKNGNPPNLWAEGGGSYFIVNH